MVKARGGKGQRKKRKGGEASRKARASVQTKKTKNGFVAVVERNAFTLIMVAVALAAVLVYLNSLPNIFVFNVADEILNNESIRALSNIPGFFLAPTSEPSPVAYATFAIDNAIWGLEPWGFRLTNILLHTVASIAVGIFALQVLGRRGAVVTALVFALHPVHTEAVTGIVGRGEILAVIFLLISFVLFLKSGRRRLYATSVALFVLGLLSSRGVVAMPLALLLYSLFFLDKRAAIRSVPYFVFSIVYIVIYLFMAPASAISSDGVTFFAALKVFGLYAAKLVFPVGLNAWYAFSLPESFLSFETVVPLQALVVIVLVAVFACRRLPVLTFSLLFVVMALSPFLHILPQASLMREAYLYLPSVGVCLLAGLFFEEAARRIEVKYVAIIIAVPLLISVILTFQRNTVWADNHSILADTVVKSPESVLVHYNLAVLYDKLGMLERALAEYDLVIEMNPGMAVAYYGTACIYARLGDIDEGMKALKWAVAMGFRDIELLRNDPDLDNLREDSAFAGVLKKAATGEALH